MNTHVMPRSHIHGSPRRFHYGSNLTDDPGNDNFRSLIGMHNASTTTYDYECSREIYRLIRIATDDAGSHPWLILRQIRECVTWAFDPLYPCKRFTDEQKRFFSKAIAATLPGRDWIHVYRNIRGCCGIIPES